METQSHKAKNKYQTGNRIYTVLDPIHPENQKIVSKFIQRKTKLKHSTLNTEWLPFIHGAFLQNYNWLKWGQKSTMC